MYGFEVWSSFNKNGNGDSRSNIEHNVKIKGKVEDKTLEGFLDDADYLKFTIKKLGRSKEERSTDVHSSSFSTYYDYDFDVICYKRKNFEDKEGEEIYHKKFEQITIGSYFYSGGW